MTALLAWALVSCDRVEDVSDDFGYLSFYTISIDYSVEGLMPTKANVPDKDMPQADDFTYIVNAPDGEELMRIEPGSASEVRVPVGTYSVEAVCGENQFGIPYFHSVATNVTISREETTVVDFENIPLANSMLAITLPDNFDKHFVLSSVRLSDGERTMIVSPGEYVYVPSGREISVTFVGTNSIEANKEIGVSLGILNPQTAYNIECNLNLPQIVLPSQSDGAWATRLYVTPATIESSLSSGKIIYEVVEATSSNWSEPIAISEVISGDYHVVKGLENGKEYKVRARVGNVISNEETFKVDEFKEGATYNIAHTYDANSYLTGTTVTADLKLTGILKTLHDAGIIQTTVSLKNGSQVYRTTNAISGTLSGSDTWPYVPKGTSYSLDVSHKVQGDSDVVSSIVPSVTVPAPKISVEVSAYTTYDRYLDYKKGKSALSLANNSEKRLVVEERKVVLSVSNTILEKTPSLLSSSVTYNGSQLTGFSSSNTLTYDNVTYTDSQWGEYVFSASVNFDGVTASDSHDCWITGLPYNVDFDANRKNQSWEGWTSNSATWTRTSALYWKLKLNKGYIVSPKFYVPADINISAYVECQYYKVGSGSSTYTLGPTTGVNQKATADLATASVSGQVYTDRYGDNNFTVSTVLRTNKEYLSVTASEEKSFVYEITLSFR